MKPKIHKTYHLHDEIISHSILETESESESEQTEELAGSNTAQ